MTRKPISTYIEGRRMKVKDYFEDCKDTSRNQKTFISRNEFDS